MWQRCIAVSPRELLAHKNTTDEALQEESSPNQGRRAALISSIKHVVKLYILWKEVAVHQEMFRFHHKMLDSKRGDGNLTRGCFLKSIFRSFDTPEIPGVRNKVLEMTQGQKPECQQSVVIGAVTFSDTNNAPILAFGEGGLLLTMSISSKKKLENKLIPEKQRWWNLKHDHRTFVVWNGKDFFKKKSTGSHWWFLLSTVKWISILAMKAFWHSTVSLHLISIDR